MSHATVQPNAAEVANPAPSTAAHHAPLAAQGTEPGTEQSRIPTTDLLRRQMAHCGEYTFQALNKIGKLSPEDTGRITQMYLKYLTTVEKGRPFADSLVYLVLEGWKRPENEARDTILRLTKSLIAYSKAKVSPMAPEADRS